LHLLLWSAYFPTLAEKYLWRICASIIAASGVIAGYMVLIVSDRTDPLPRYLKPIMWPFRRFILILSALLGPSRVVNISAQLTLIAACVLGPCYVAARAFIVVECLISLRQLPVDAYKVPLWSQFWPHV
jgi:predicted membrane protein